MKSHSRQVILKIKLSNTVPDISYGQCAISCSVPTQHCESVVGSFKSNWKLNPLLIFNWLCHFTFCKGPIIYVGRIHPTLSRHSNNFRRKNFTCYHDKQRRYKFILGYFLSKSSIMSYYYRVYVCYVGFLQFINLFQYKRLDCYGWPDTYQYLYSWNTFYLYYSIISRAIVQRVFFWRKMLRSRLFMRDVVTIKSNRPFQWKFCTCTQTVFHIYSFFNRLYAYMLCDMLYDSF